MSDVLVGEVRKLRRTLIALVATILVAFTAGGIAVILYYEAHTARAINDREHDICARIADFQYSETFLVSSWERKYADCVDRNGFRSN